VPPAWLFGMLPRTVQCWQSFEHRPPPLERQSGIVQAHRQTAALDGKDEVKIAERIGSSVDGAHAPDRDSIAHCHSRDSTPDSTNAGTWAMPPAPRAAHTQNATQARLDRLDCARASGATLMVHSTDASRRAFVSATPNGCSIIGWIFGLMPKSKANAHETVALCTLRHLATTP
jgi:hypothetical protein